MDPRDLNAAVLSRRDLNEFLSIVRIRPDSGVVPEFEPGQFIQVGLPREEAHGSGTPSSSTPVPAADAPPRVRWVRRPYSIASPAQCREYVELFLARIDYGRLTPRLWTLHEGDRLWLDGRAAGEFTLEHVPADRDLVLVASGTGVAPFVSMLRTYRAKRPWRRLTIVNGVRFASDLGFRDELTAAARDDETVHYVPIVSREPPDSPWTGLRGRVQRVFQDGVYESLTGTELDPQRAHVMLCGNPQMILDVEALLSTRGFRRHSRREPGNLHYERYW